MDGVERFVIEHDNPRWREVLEVCVESIRGIAEAGDDFMVRLSDVTRTLEQNAAMWPALRDFARDVPLAITMNSGGTRDAEPEDWKAVLTAAFERETEMAPGLYGGIVMLGSSTSRYGKRKMSDFLTFVRAEGDQRGVNWSKRALDNFDEYIY